MSPLHQAITNDDADLKALVTQHNINEYTESGETPLHMAIRLNKPTHAKTLIDLGADIFLVAREDIFSVSGNALELAICYERVDIAMLIIEYCKNDFNLNCRLFHTLKPSPLEFIFEHVEAPSNEFVLMVFQIWSGFKDSFLYIAHFDESIWAMEKSKYDISMQSQMSILPMLIKNRNTHLLTEILYEISVKNNFLSQIRTKFKLFDINEIKVNSKYGAKTCYEFAILNDEPDIIQILLNYSDISSKELSKMIIFCVQADRYHLIQLFLEVNTPPNWPDIIIATGNMSNQVRSRFRQSLGHHTIRFNYALEQFLRYGAYEGTSTIFDLIGHFSHKITYRKIVNFFKYTFIMLPFLMIMTMLYYVGLITPRNNRIRSNIITEPSKKNTLTMLDKLLNHPGFKHFIACEERIINDGQLRIQFRRNTFYLKLSDFIEKNKDNKQYQITTKHFIESLETFFNINYDADNALFELSNIGVCDVSFRTLKETFIKELASESPQGQVEKVIMYSRNAIGNKISMLEDSMNYIDTIWATQDELSQIDVYLNKTPSRFVYLNIPKKYTQGLEQFILKLKEYKVRWVAKNQEGNFLIVQQLSKLKTANQLIMNGLMQIAESVVKSNEDKAAILKKLKPYKSQINKLSTMIAEFTEEILCIKSEQHAIKKHIRELPKNYNNLVEKIVSAFEKNKKPPAAPTSLLSQKNKSSKKSSRRPVKRDKPKKVESKIEQKDEREEDYYIDLRRAIAWSTIPDVYDLDYSSGDEDDPRAQPSAGFWYTKEQGRLDSLSFINEKAEVDDSRYHDHPLKETNLVIRAREHLDSICQLQNASNNYINKESRTLYYMAIQLKLIQFYNLLSLSSNVCKSIRVLLIHHYYRFDAQHLLTQLLELTIHLFKENLQNWLDNNSEIKIKIERQLMHFIDDKQLKNLHEDERDIDYCLNEIVRYRALLTSSKVSLARLNQSDKVLQLGFTMLLRNIGQIDLKFTKEFGREYAEIVQLPKLFTNLSHTMRVEVRNVVGHKYNPREVNRDSTFRDLPSAEKIQRLLIDLRELFSHFADRIGVTESSLLLNAKP